MAVADFEATINFAAGSGVLRPGDRVEIDVAVDTEWAPVVAAGWVQSATSNAIDDPNPESSPDW